MRYLQLFIEFINGKPAGSLFIIFALVIAFLPWFAPLVFIGLLGLFLVIGSSTRWGVIGGLVSTTWAGGVVIVAYNLQGGNLANIIVSIFAYLLLGTILGTGIDLHRRQKADLLASEEKHRILYETMAQGVIYQAADGGIVSVNPAAERILGRKSGEMLEKTSMDPSWQSIDESGKKVPGSEHPAMVALRTGRPCGPFVMGIYNPEKKHHVWLSITAIPLFRPGETKPFQAYASFENITKRKKAEEDLARANKNMSTVLENTIIGVTIIDKNRKIVWANPVACEMAGVESVNELKNKYCAHYFCTEDQVKCPVLDLGQPVENSEHILRKADGRVVPILKTVTEIHYEGEEMLLESFIDITERKKADEERSSNENRLRALVELSQAHYESVEELLDQSLDRALALTGSKLGYIYYYDEENRVFSLNSWSKEAMKECAVIEKKTIYELKNTGIWGEVVRQGKPLLINDFKADHPLKKGYPEGHVQLHRFLSIPVFNNGRIEAVVGVGNKEEDYSHTDTLQLNLLMDFVWKIVERKKNEEKIQHISFHDQLTGLYNRHYFANELKRLENSREYPIALVSADLDGLKLVNDTLGHAEGDRYLKTCAGLLKESLRSSDLLARVGGDEFALILPRTDKNTGTKIVERIYQGFEGYNEKNEKDLPLGISLGLAVSESEGQSLEAAYQDADALMYKTKLKNSKEVRSSMIRSMLALLYNEKGIDSGNNELVQEICARLGQEVKLSEEKLAALMLLAQVHDLGMITVPRDTLAKKDNLSGREQEQIRQHTERGYRIALASPELAEVADLILHHHENWDGSGYPLGLKGTEIPVECRILALATTYQELISGKPGCEAKSHTEALEEIGKLSGSIFDPDLTGLLLNTAQGKGPPGAGSP